MRPWPLALALMLGAAVPAPELARSQPAISNQELADRSWMVERAATLNCELKKGQIRHGSCLRKDFQEQGLDHLLPWSSSNNAAVAVKLIERRLDEDCQIDETERMALNQDIWKCARGARAWGCGGP